jgi:hypothetical protein
VGLQQALVRRMRMNGIVHLAVGPQATEQVRVVADLLARDLPEGVGAPLPQPPR